MGAVKTEGEMERVYWIMAAMLVASGCASCGEDETANGDQNAATNNDATNNATANNSNNDAPPRGWGAEVTGGGVDLPALEGDEAILTNRVTYNQLEGGGSPGGSLTIELSGAQFQVMEYPAPRRVEVRFTDLAYRCSADDGLTVTVTELDPAAGEFSGPVECELTSDVSQRFDAEVTGWFRATVD